VEILHFIEEQTAKVSKQLRCWMRRQGVTALVLTLAAFCVPEALAQAKKPNILVLWGDGIGVHNISAYSQGIMGYKTPNIDRIGKEGAILTGFYAQQSCTAGRA